MGRQTLLKSWQSLGTLCPVFELLFPQRSGSAFHYSQSKGHALWGFPSLFQKPANWTSNTISPRNQHCFLSHPGFRLKKRERERKVPVCDEPRSGFSVGIFVKNCHPSADNVTVSWSTFSHHVRPWCGMCTACVTH